MRRTFALLLCVSILPGPWAYADLITATPKIEMLSNSQPVTLTRGANEWSSSEKQTFADLCARAGGKPVSERGQSCLCPEREKQSSVLLTLDQLDRGDRCLSSTLEALNGFNTFDLLSAQSGMTCGDSREPAVQVPDSLLVSSTSTPLKGLSLFPPAEKSRAEAPGKGSCEDRLKDSQGEIMQCMGEVFAGIQSGKLRFRGTGPLTMSGKAGMCVAKLGDKHPELRNAMLAYVSRVLHEQTESRIKVIQQKLSAGMKLSPEELTLVGDLEEELSQSDPNAKKGQLLAGFEAEAQEKAPYMEELGRFGLKVTDEGYDFSSYVGPGGLEKLRQAVGVGGSGSARFRNALDKVFGEGTSGQLTQALAKRDENSDPQPAYRLGNLVVQPNWGYSNPDPNSPPDEPILVDTRTYSFATTSAITRFREKLSAQRQASQSRSGYLGGLRRAGRALTLRGGELAEDQILDRAQKENAQTLTNLQYRLGVDAEMVKELMRQDQEVAQEATADASQAVDRIRNLEYATYGVAAAAIAIPTIAVGAGAVIAALPAAAGAAGGVLTVGGVQITGASIASGAATAVVSGVVTDALVSVPEALARSSMGQGTFWCNLGETAGNKITASLSPGAVLKTIGMSILMGPVLRGILAKGGGALLARATGKAAIDSLKIATKGVNVAADAYSQVGAVRGALATRAEIEAGLDQVEALRKQGDYEGAYRLAGNLAAEGTAAIWREPISSAQSMVQRKLSDQIAKRRAIRNRMASMVTEEAYDERVLAAGPKRDPDEPGPVFEKRKQEFQARVPQILKELRPKPGEDMLAYQERRLKVFKDSGAQYDYAPSNAGLKFISPARAKDAPLVDGEIALGYDLKSGRGNGTLVYSDAHLGGSEAGTRATAGQRFQNLLGFVKENRGAVGKIILNGDLVDQGFIPKGKTAVQAQAMQEAVITAMVRKVQLAAGPGVKIEVVIGNHDITRAREIKVGAQTFKLERGKVGDFEKEGPALIAALEASKNPEQVLLGQRLAKNKKYVFYDLEAANKTAAALRAIPGVTVVSGDPETPAKTKLADGRTALVGHVPQTYGPNQTRLLGTKYHQEQKLNMESGIQIDGDVDTVIASDQHTMGQILAKNIQSGKDLDFFYTGSGGSHIKQSGNDHSFLFIGGETRQGHFISLENPGRPIQMEEVVYVNPTTGVPAK